MVRYLKLKAEYHPKKIRADYEISLLRLIEKVTNGTVIEISLTGMLPPSLIPLCIRQGG